MDEKKTGSTCEAEEKPEVMTFKLCPSIYKLISFAGSMDGFIRITPAVAKVHMK